MARIVNVEFVNGLLVLAYLLLGTVGLAPLMAWTLKRFGPPKK